MKVLTIGGGIAGMEASIALAEMGHEVTILEKNKTTGGKLNHMYLLFPDMKPYWELEGYFKNIFSLKNIIIESNTDISEIKNEKKKYVIKTTSGKLFNGDAVIMATGYDYFNAMRKEEYGYGIYDNVITSVDFEEMLRKGKSIVNKKGIKPNRIAFIHCVGSRDEKCGNHYCSKVCCVTGVKQAIETRKHLPGARIYNFYMDLRMYGQHFEELYRQAQEKFSIQFIRGRLSEASEKIDGSIQLKAEDTLSGRPLKMDVDLMVLLIGIEAGKGTNEVNKLLKIEKSDNRFLKPLDIHLKSNVTSLPGVFLAGTCSGPMSVNDTISHARSAAIEVNNYLQKSIN